MDTGKTISVRKLLDELRTPWHIADNATGVSPRGEVYRDMVYSKYAEAAADLIEQIGTMFPEVLDLDNAEVQVNAE